MTDLVAWISIGFDSEILNSVPQTRSDNNGIYDYSAVLEKMNVYEVDSEATGGSSPIERTADFTDLAIGSLSPQLFLR